MKNFKYALLHILEFVGVYILFFMLAQIAFWAMNQASSIANIAGFLFLLAIATSTVFYSIEFAKRVYKDLNQ